jgi:glutaminyl-tRNA synthetase
MFPENFIDKEIKLHIRQQTSRAKTPLIITRFPPEPSGYLHVGHIKSIALNFGMAQKYAGKCNLRFDDSNPCTATKPYTEQIIADVKWLGYTPHQITYTSDYFPTFYEYALYLIKTKKAYVCDLSAEEIQHYRGTLVKGGTDSPYRYRNVVENMMLFQGMYEGVYPEGSKTLRASIDMKSGNINMRDPVLFRIRTQCAHYRYGKRWFIYPSYIFSHVLSDVIEGITHSLCTIEFEDQRPLYNWILCYCGVTHHPEQIEFARLNVSGMITSKRAITKLLAETADLNDLGDPRLDTIAGLRNRGYHPQGLIEFCYQTGISKQNSCIAKTELDRHQRLFLEDKAVRRFVILSPLLVEIRDQKATTMQMPNHPSEELGERVVPISSQVYIERNDFTLNLQKHERKLSPHRAVILMGYGLVRCYKYDLCDEHHVAKVYVERVEEAGTRYDATISWVDVNTACRLPLVEVQGGGYISYDALAEKAMASDKHGMYYQAYRLGYIKRQTTSKLVVRLKQGK